MPPTSPDAAAVPRSVRVVNLGLTLLLVGGITWLATGLSLPGFEGGRLTVLMGFVLLAASLAGGLAAAAGLPRLTGFLLVGIAAGPSVLGILPAPAVEELRLIDDFALALIALLAGGELKVGSVRAQARPILLATLAVTLVVWVGMTGVVLAVRPLVPFLADLPLNAALGVAVLVGIWMANSSPDLTVAVIEESGAKGAFTDVVLGVTIVKDVLVIVLFTLTLSLVGPLIRTGEGFRAGVLVELGQHVGGAVVVGAFLGWVFSLYLGSEDGRPRPPMATFLFAYVLVVVAARLHLELLLTAVAAGFVIENLSSAGDRMIRGIESVSVVIFAFFFAIAGAGLELAAIRRFWLAALLLFAARALLTWLGAHLGARWADASGDVRARLWQGLISQGGVSLLLVLSVRETYPSVGGGVVALAMAVIIGNILGGPVLLKRALTRGSPG
ncbi:MAG: cation:proton antiporter [Longimicrobiales bacterium]|nr:cation:proton antiporter [Longimicrobiales bacterium]